MFFASDNGSPVHPRVMDAIVDANQGYVSSYGADAIMDEVRERIRDLFEAPEAAVYLVSTGSTANALSLASFCPPWGAIYCHRRAHIEEDECGAPEFFTGGAKVVLVDGDAPTMTPDALRAALHRTRHGDVHSVQRGMFSITNVAELGAVYSPAEVRALTDIARAEGLPCHMDGARFANAIAASGATPAEMTWKAGIDVLSFGGTKNGLMGVEAVVLFDPQKAWEFELRRKRGGHLFSKHRYLSAQMLAYLTDDLWLDMARNANAMAQRLGTGLRQMPDVEIQHAMDANIVFAKWPRIGHRTLQDSGARYYLTANGASLEGAESDPLPARLVASWCTRDEDVDRFLSILQGSFAAL